jgi:hypothetical protein
VFLYHELHHFSLCHRRKTVCGFSVFYHTAEKKTTKKEHLMSDNIAGRYQHSDGNINTNSVSELTRPFATDLAHRIWEYSSHSENAVNNLFDKLERLNNNGQEAEVMGLLKTVCGKIGFAVSDEVETATQEPQTRTAFILSFLSDYDDALLDL